MSFVGAKDVVKELGDGIRDGCWGGIGNIGPTGVEAVMPNLQNKYIRQSTNGTHLAPMASPCLTQTAWGMILNEDRE